jgi:hypothetical protein
MSVALTEEAVRARRKTETRRLGWLKLPVGVDLDLCRKVMGRQGAPLVRIARVHVVSVSRERLDAITDEAVYREGFTDEDLARAPWGGDAPYLRDELNTPRQWFVEFWCRHMGGTERHEVTVIQWRYVFDFDRFIPAPAGPNGEERWYCTDCIPAIHSRDLHDAAHHIGEPSSWPGTSHATTCAP